MKFYNELHQPPISVDWKDPDIVEIAKRLGATLNQSIPFLKVHHALASLSGTSLSLVSGTEITSLVNFALIFARAFFNQEEWRSHPRNTDLLIVGETDPTGKTLVESRKVPVNKPKTFSNMESVEIVALIDELLVTFSLLGRGLRKNRIPPVALEGVSKMKKRLLRAEKHQKRGAFSRRVNKSSRRRAGKGKSIKFTKL